MPSSQTPPPPSPLPLEVGTYQAVRPEDINPVDGNAPPVTDASLEGNDPNGDPDDVEDEFNPDGYHPQPNQVYGDDYSDDYSDEEGEEDEEDNVNHDQTPIIGTVFLPDGSEDTSPSDDERVASIVNGAANILFQYLRGESPNVANGASMTDEAIDYVLTEMPHRQGDIRDLMDLLQRLQNRNRNDVEFLRSVREPAPPPPPALRRSSRLSGQEGGN